jgi:UDP-glucose 4-epimerase
MNARFFRARARHREGVSTMKVLVTGGAGFIGSNLVDRFLSRGDQVVVVDNLTTGNRRFLDAALAHPACRLLQLDLFKDGGLADAMAGCDLVVHLAANADVRFGTEHPSRDLEQNTIVTFKVLEAMRAAGVKRIAFSSTGSIYGEPAVFPTPENAPFPVQTSLYGASKLACEGLIQAYCEGYGFEGHIFRFVSILGERYSHGHVFDFVRRLRANPAELTILGDGKQRKSYLYVQDCVDAIFLALEKSREKLNLFNLGTDEYCAVSDSVGWICGRLGVEPKRLYSGGTRGWIGDSPFIFLDCSRIRALGWKPRLSIRDGVLKTVDYLLANPWLMDERTH